MLELKNIDYIKKRFGNSTSSIGVVGNGLILEKEYDPDQLWFDFMDNCIFFFIKEDVPTKLKLQKQIVCPDPQLPFFGSKELTRREWKALRNYGFQSFDKKNDVNFTSSFEDLFSFKIKNNINTHEASEWCKLNCLHRFFTRCMSPPGSYRSFYFESKIDAINAKLRWSNGD